MTEKNPEQCFAVQFCETYLWDALELAKQWTLENMGEKVIDLTAKYNHEDEDWVITIFIQ